MEWKYKKDDILMYNNKSDSNNYHYYELDSLTTKPFFNKFIDKNLLENSTSLDKNFNRQRKINRLINEKK